MNPLIRSLRFSTLPRSALAARHAPKRLQIRPITPLIPLRTVANTVGPGSQSLSHARQNMKEEAGNSVKDLAKAIAGVNPAKDDSFTAITGSLASEVPSSVMTFGLAGGLPYIGAAATTVYLAREATLGATSIDPGVAITVLDQALNLQVTYGAVMLSFLGALHWGMEFSGLGGHHGWRRLALGAAPVLYAWPTLAMDPTMALCAQWAGFTALWWADSRATVAGWTPKWYSQYRFYLSILVGTCILGSLAGITYWGPVGGHGLLDHELHDIRKERATLQKQPEVLYGKEMTILPGEDTFTRLRKTEDIEKEQAERAEKEAEKEKAQNKWIKTVMVVLKHKKLGPGLGAKASMAKASGARARSSLARKPIGNKLTTLQIEARTTMQHRFAQTRPQRFYERVDYSLEKLYLKVIDVQRRLYASLRRFVGTQMVLRSAVRPLTCRDAHWLARIEPSLKRRRPIVRSSYRWGKPKTLPRRVKSKSRFKTKVPRSSDARVCSLAEQRDKLMGSCAGSQLIPSHVIPDATDRFWPQTYSATIARRANACRTMKNGPQQTFVWRRTRSSLCNVYAVPNQTLVPAASDPEFAEQVSACQGPVHRSPSIITEGISYTTHGHSRLPLEAKKRDADRAGMDWADERCYKKSRMMKLVLGEDPGHCTPNYSP
ncbi:unnamed protein product [Mycena citricolor]|uniref:Mnn4-regulates the mannosylphosphorylation n=1 Tax=Mycena citricolor TaxID=2018698 RepID=A0AAD2GZK5_9AGAR|nr:unnamed protein product [Mycena citricolor]